ncbi:retrovirus-related Pol polyprotein from type-1 retrotransposable element R2 [Trichonephila clavata]|uniref:Retrovirus-related Pol polyprotein from type-1 retrotransposable element R2 n=1 Tax=Trichonephila clavata TaxID=2740835 RepID=A0A8X6HGU5_TRICU|nr:retrovirus-related Pol polyprotein from type-1 retrotransposable element R2 [Trichonephila clavata]
MATASTHFLTEGKYTRFADWRFVHRARLGLVPLNGYKYWAPRPQRLCRKCGKWDETLPHVLNHCPSYSAAWQMRHNAIVARVKKAVAFKGTILHENQAIGPDNLRPDLVALVDGTTYIIDVTIPFENRREAFAQARQRKITKYNQLLSHFASLGATKVSIVPILVGSLGSWDPDNDAFLKLVATRSYLGLLRKLCVSDCIRWSRDIYVQHLTGAQQYSAGAVTLHPDPAAVEEQVSTQEQVNAQHSSTSQQSTPNGDHSQQPNSQVSDAPSVEDTTVALCMPTCSQLVECSAPRDNSCEQTSPVVGDATTTDM